MSEESRIDLSKGEASLMHSSRSAHVHDRMRTAVLIAVLLATGACESEQQPPEATVPVQPDERTDGTPGMPGMQPMPGMQNMPGMQTQMSARVTAHMHAMQGVSADSLRSVMPMHRQMVANMIAQMNREMRDMNMAGDTRWNATVDSLRTDLINMPDMNDQELEVMMPAHHDRVARLMEMHDAMMASMQRNEGDASLPGGDHD